jgi:hypothetical protein
MWIPAQKAFGGKYHTGSAKPALDRAFGRESFIKRSETLCFFVSFYRYNLRTGDATHGYQTGVCQRSIKNNRAGAAFALQTSALHTGIPVLLPQNIKQSRSSTAIPDCRFTV